MSDLKESVIASIERLLHDMQTPNYRNGSRAAGIEPERLAAEAIYGMIFSRIVEPIDRSLQVPAAEYVPAIGDVFIHIDRYK